VRRFIWQTQRNYDKEKRQKIQNLCHEMQLTVIVFYHSVRSVDAATSLKLFWEKKTGVSEKKGKERIKKRFVFCFCHYTYFSTIIASDNILTFIHIFSRVDRRVSNGQVRYLHVSGSKNPYMDIHMDIYWLKIWHGYP